MVPLDLFGIRSRSWNQKAPRGIQLPGCGAPQRMNQLCLENHNSQASYTMSALLSLAVLMVSLCFFSASRGIQFWVCPFNKWELAIVHCWLKQNCIGTLSERLKLRLRMRLGRRLMCCVSFTISHHQPLWRQAFEAAWHASSLHGSCAQSYENRPGEQKLIACETQILQRKPMC